MLLDQVLVQLSFYALSFGKSSSWLRFFVRNRVLLFFLDSFEKLEIAQKEKTRKRKHSGNEPGKSRCNFDISVLLSSSADTLSLKRVLVSLDCVAIATCPVRF